MATTTTTPNDIIDLDEAVNGKRIGWVNKNTAMIVFHGIGNQLPLETLDQFGRGLIKEFKKEDGRQFTLHHELVAKPGDGNDVWFDNVLRIKKDGSKHYIDLYEYYWANYTEDQASWKDINTWLQGIIKGAKSFYKDGSNQKLGEDYQDKSMFFDKEGKFKPGKYRLVLSLIPKVLMLVNVIVNGFIGLVSRFFGGAAASMLESYKDTAVHNIANVMGDIVVYNNADPKSKYYPARRKIMDGAVKAVRFLIERQENEDIDLVKLKQEYHMKKAGLNADECGALDKELREKLKNEKLYYPSVIVVGHSLGTQVSYDAINKLNLLVNKGVIKTYAGDGTCLLNNNTTLADQLNGYITFGSPLDKIVFFLRENIPNKEYLRQQFLDNYHGFKQRPISQKLNNEETNAAFVRAGCELKRLMEEVKWRNYFDGKDYVSGGLDYYTKLTNVNCKFDAPGQFAFTHSNYWEHENFYKDIIINYLS